MALFSRKADLMTTLKRPISSVRDADIRTILEELAPGKEIHTVICPPRLRFNVVREENNEGGEQKVRYSDKEYYVDGLAVFVEAELGRKIYLSSLKDIVTVDEQREYEKLFAAAQRVAARNILEPHKRKTQRVKEREANILDQGMNYIEAPLVEQGNDGEELKTIRVMSVYVKYDGIIIGQLTAPDWEGFIDAIAKKYDVNIGPADGENLEQEVFFFNKTISNTTDVAEYRQGISAVYKAGSILKVALEERTRELIRKYLPQ